MTSLLILLFTLFIIVTVRLANATYREGDYTRDTEKILQGIDEDKSVHEGRVANNIFLHHVPFKDICNEATKDEKLSICLKVLQHMWHLLEPTTITIDPNESNCECKPTKFTARNRTVLYQRMYLCPRALLHVPNIDYSDTPFYEEPFYIGQGLHNTQYRIRFFERDPEGGAAKINGQVTGFKLDVVNFAWDLKGHMEYWPDYDDDIEPLVCPVENFRQRGRMDDYLVQWELAPAQ